MPRPLRRLGLIALAAIATLAVAGMTVAFYQGRQTPAGRPIYVALGSSFAAGAGLGALQHGSPLLCARSINGYPQRLARLLRLDIVDMSCGGAVTKHLLSGGQFFQGAQIRTITPETRLVTITVGGNDVGYVGDMSMLAARNSHSLFGRGVRQFWGGPKSMTERDFPELARTLSVLLKGIHQRAPQARIVVATYPTILPAQGTCATIGLSPAEADTMRAVADQLAATTREVARQGGATIVDMHVLGAAHNACSGAPWTRGWANGDIAPFHPTIAGAQATAEAIARALGGSPDRIAAVD